MKSNKILFTFIFLFSFILSVSAYSQCGKERWDVKTLADPEVADIVKTPELTSVANLRKEKVKKITGDNSRQGIEFKTFELLCYIKFYFKEDDKDYHVVICDQLNKKLTMIAEVPDPDNCPEVPKKFADEFRKIRKFLEDHKTKNDNKGRHLIDSKILFRITGVAFIDFPHNQTGRAPNSIEIHPILKIEEFEQ
jgi:hypothetical protein